MAAAAVAVVGAARLVPARAGPGLDRRRRRRDRGRARRLGRADPRRARRPAPRRRLVRPVHRTGSADHHALPVDASLDAFGGSAALADPAFRLSSPAFYEIVHGTPGAAGTTADVLPQFFLGAPAWFSLGGWTGGWTGLLVAPAVASALALLAFAGLAARLVGPRWAVLATGVLALAQPVLHAARSTYSEPLALLLVCAAGALLVDAVRAGNPAAAGRTAATGSRTPAGSRSPRASPPGWPAWCGSTRCGRSCCSCRWPRCSPGAATPPRARW